MELNHVTPPEERNDHHRSLWPRRSSVSSVKDLVQDFERMQELANPDDVRVIKKIGSMDNLRVSRSQMQADARPKWKP